MNKDKAESACEVQVRRPSDWVGIEVAADRDSAFAALVECVNQSQRSHPVQDALRLQEMRVVDADGRAYYPYRGSRGEVRFDDEFGIPCSYDGVARRRVPLGAMNIAPLRGKKVSNLPSGR